MGRGSPGLGLPHREARWQVHPTGHREQLVSPMPLTGKADQEGRGWAGSPQHKRQGPRQEGERGEAWKGDPEEEDCVAETVRETGCYHRRPRPHGTCKLSRPDQQAAAGRGQCPGNRPEGGPSTQPKATPDGRENEGRAFSENNPGKLSEQKYTGLQTPHATHSRGRSHEVPVPSTASPPTDRPRTEWSTHRRRVRPDQCRPPGHPGNGDHGLLRACT